MFCWHKWSILRTEVLPSMIEQLDAAGQMMEEYRGSTTPSYKPALVTKRCIKCGTQKVERV